jgi:hypothetical protein
MNKRFLLNVVKATDSHNQALIRAAETQAEANKNRIRAERYATQRSRPPVKDSRRRKHSRSPSPLSDTGKRRKPTSRSLRRSTDEGTSLTPNEGSPSDSSAFERSPSPEGKRQPTIFKGRGNITASGPSAMDKYFSKLYDPSKDTGEAVDDDGWVIDSDSTQKISNKKKKKKKRQHDEQHLKPNHKSKKHKKDKKENRSERIITIDTGAVSDNKPNDGIVYSNSVREWDLAKTNRRA